MNSNLNVGGDSFISGLNSAFDRLIERCEPLIDKLIDSANVGVTHGVNSNSQTFNFQMGDINLSGVFDKEADENVRDIVNEIIDGFAVELKEVFI